MFSEHFNLFGYGEHLPDGFYYVLSKTRQMYVQGFELDDDRGLVIHICYMGMPICWEHYARIWKPVKVLTPGDARELCSDHASQNDRPECKLCSIVLRSKPLTVIKLDVERYDPYQGVRNDAEDEEYREAENMQEEADVYFGRHTEEEEQRSRTYFQELLKRGYNCT